ncbi:FliH/SctL family protein [Hydrogenophaga sp.]|uniref:FliH/SctL family protein n=1 Tax=Hydrogenophaga sp. TaxID=1904254 RepID=UPI0025B826B7|nr:FliH/SctL family protein [Hydrogenophaga sp.]
MTDSSKTPQKTSSHSRFIPREEIDAVAQWTFSSMDTNFGALIGPEETASTAIDDDTVQAAREQAYTEGYAQGREAGIREVQETMQAELQKVADEYAVRMGGLIHSLSDQLLASEQKMSRQLLELACDLARQVVRQELQVNTRQLRTVIGEALEMIVDDGLPTTIRMHPQDLALLKDALLETLGENAPDFVADTAITPGGCLVQSPTMAVDATVEKRWARAVGNLGLSVSWTTENVDG